MRLVDFLRKESTASLHKLIFMASLAGLSNTSVLAIINSASEQIAKHTQNTRYLLLFALSITLYIIAQRYVMEVSTKEVESIIDRFRVRFAALLGNCDLQQLERLGRSEIYASITTQTLTISQSIPGILVGVQSAILMFFTSIYVAWLSLPAFFIGVVFVAIALSIHSERAREITQQHHEATMRENELFDSLTDLLNGFKEIKMNSARRADLLNYIAEISHSTADIKIRAQSRIATHIILSQASFYLLLATIVFLVPRFTSIYADVLVKLTTAVLFLIGPINALTAAVPTLARANASAENIFALESALTQSISPAPPQPVRKFTKFREIVFQGVTFKYPDRPGERPFTVGPIDLTIRAHEITFITGGNGSGKSTFLKLLTGLYQPTSGVIKVDKVPIDETNREIYRNMISTVFSDYHLFKRLYGLRNIDHQKINELLREMELEEKTGLVDDEFETLELSNGQKKRLALLVSLLEDRPIFVFDEWAADQDPGFRRKFYKELLQKLKEKGKTIIAVTHDDRYFDVADRLLKMEEGKVSEE